jgi:hypothetical protein
MSPRYRKRPLEIHATRWTGENLPEIADLTAGSRDVVYDSSSNCLFVRTLEGRMRCSRGDWLVRGVEDEFYPVQDSIFTKTYEPVDVLQDA